ncbi:MAG TPA: ABC transporter permease [Acidimicrobiia bacterium]|nr:ABC transporter permease [Acidimicrobiia bacterium]
MSGPPVKARTSGWRNWLRPNLVIGGSMLLLILGIMVVGLFWTPFDSNAIDIGKRLSSPGENGYLLGSDGFGRDVVTQLMVGARSAVLVSVVSSVSALVLGVIIGGIAALRRGWVEEIIMRGSDILYSFPGVVLAIALAAVLGTSLFTAIVAIIAIFTPTTARLVRGVSLEVVNRNWFLAARGYGRRPAWIYFRQCIPNIAPILIVQGTLLFAAAVLVEAALAYLGLGVQPPTPSWGRMLRDAQQFAAVQPILAIVPGLAIVITVLGVNLIGDGLRDVLDPKLRRIR